MDAIRPAANSAVDSMNHRLTPMTKASFEDCRAWNNSWLMASFRSGQAL